MKSTLKNKSHNIEDVTKSGNISSKKKPVKKNAQTSLLQDLVSLLIKIGVVAIVFVLIFSFIFGAFRYGDMSMSPAIKDGDMVLTYRWDKRYKANDICSFSYENEMTCSRVVAVAGDKVDIGASGLRVNGAKIQENDIFAETTQVENGVTFPLTVPEGKVFVLGDNRKQAIDSRIFGCVSIDKTQGKVIGVFRHRML